MRLRSFTGSSLPDAMRSVREVLGPDAVILSSQPSDDGKGVRVTAALEDSPLEDLSSAMSPAGVSLEELGAALSYHRVPAAIYDRLLAAAATLPAENNALALGGALDSAFDFVPLPEGSTPRPLILIGPPGAGKTAMAAKLCARARLAGAEASLITMDTVKSGGLAQVTQFAEALGARLHQAPDVGTLAEAIERCPREHFVVVDTIGANPFDDDEIDRLELAAEAVGAEPIVILPAGGDIEDSAEVAAAFARTGARRLMVTKIDVTRRYGGLLSAAQTGCLAFLAASASPHISDGLLPFNPVSLARLLLPAAGSPLETSVLKETA